MVRSNILAGRAVCSDSTVHSCIMAEVRSASGSSCSVRSRYLAGGLWASRSSYTAHSVSPARSSRLVRSLDLARSHSVVHSMLSAGLGWLLLRYGTLSNVGCEGAKRPPLHVGGTLIVAGSTMTVHSSLTAGAGLCPRSGGTVHSKMMAPILRYSRKSWLAPHVRHTHIARLALTARYTLTAWLAPRVRHTRISRLNSLGTLNRLGWLSTLGTLRGLGYQRTSATPKQTPVTTDAAIPQGNGRA